METCCDRRLRRSSLKTRLRVMVINQVVNFADGSIARGMLPDPDKHLLPDILGVGGAAKHLCRSADDTVLMPCRPAFQMPQGRQP